MGGFLKIIFCSLLFVKFQNLEILLYLFIIIKFLLFKFFFSPSFLITIFIFITTSLLFLTHQHGYEKTN